MFPSPHLLAASLLAPLLVRAQFPPTPEGITLLKSKFNENITISYKEASTITHEPSSTKKMDQ